MNATMLEPRHRPHSFGDYAYDSIYLAGIGGGFVALFFLVYDIVTHGEPLFTPSLMGSVLFEGASPLVAHVVSMTAVAKYTVVHFLAFGALGLALSFLTHQAEIRSKHPLLVIGLVFALLEVGFWIAASLAIPGVIDRIGHGPVAAANLIAAVGIGVFLAVTHKQELLAHAKRAA